MSSYTEPGLVYAEDAEAFLHTAKEFVRREVSPHLDQWRSAAAAPRELFRRAADIGLLGIMAPSEVGGLGSVDRRFCHQSTRAFVDAGAFGAAWIVGLHADVAIPAIKDGHQGEERDELLASAASGQRVLAIAGLSDVIRMSADGTLDGTARGVAAAGVADTFLVLVTGDDGNRKVVCVPSSDVEVQDSAPPLGAVESGARSVVLNGVRVGQDAVLSAGTADSLVAAALLLAGGIALASAEFCIEHTAQYVTGRSVFGRPVSEFGNTRAMIADARADVLVMKSFHDRTLATTAGRAPLPSSVCALALRAAGLFSRCADIGLQLHGGYGYMSEYPISHAFAAARYFALVVDGLPEITETLAIDAGLIAITGVER
ncbi:acyl-CoA dehydrogenase family protein [Nocardia sp. NPDC059239]|uniref:acyl-CoA dehydrogenase family protein n=1 Tax=unclassified Nocardia TaxID=2637762 RepID=UPI0036953041